MKTQRKILVMTRHGDTLNVDGKRLDAITGDSITRLYENTGGVLRPHTKSDNTETAFLYHSDKKRTLYTGKAILAGAFYLFPIPTSQEDLDNLSFHGAEIQVDSRLGYEDLAYNEEAVEKEGLEEYIRKWIAQPKATEYGGVRITPFNEVVQRSRKCLQNAISTLEHGKKLGVLATHGSLVEALAIAAMNTVKSIPIQDVNEIGGIFDREAFAMLILDQKEKSGSYQASLQRNGQDYPLDLSRL